MHVTIGHMAKRALPFAVFFLLPSCSWPAAEAPPSHSTTVEPTLRGLGALFEAECLKQRSTDWAFRRWQNAIDACWGDDDCEINITNRARWTVGTTDGRQIIMRYDWGVDQQGIRSKPVRCSMSVPSGLEPVLRQIVTGARYGRRSYATGGFVRMVGEMDVWRWQPGGNKFGDRGIPWLELRHYHAAPADSADDDSYASLREYAQQPWELFYQPMGGVF